jgi:hypothetical protein
VLGASPADRLVTRRHSFDFAEKLIGHRAEIYRLILIWARAVLAQDALSSEAMRARF